MSRFADVLPTENLWANARLSHGVTGWQRIVEDHILVPARSLIHAYNGAEIEPLVWRYDGALGRIQYTTWRTVVDVGAGSLGRQLAIRSLPAGIRKATFGGGYHAAGYVATVTHKMSRSMDIATSKLQPTGRQLACIFEWRNVGVRMGISPYEVGVGGVTWHPVTWMIPRAGHEGFLGGDIIHVGGDT